MIFVSYTLLTFELVECMTDMYFQFLFFQVLQVLLHYGQEWLKFFIFSEFKLVKIFMIEMPDPERG